MGHAKLLNLNYLLNFIQIVEWGNISKAAAFLNVAQPALSRQIKSLEDTLGTRLLRRHSWGVEPTEDGKLLLEHARRIQKECNDAKESLQSNKDIRLEPFFWGCHPPIRWRWSHRYCIACEHYIRIFQCMLSKRLVARFTNG